MRLTAILVTIGLPAIRRRMKELELALLQYQQNIEIPEVNLVFHPVIQRAADAVRDLLEFALLLYPIVSDSACWLLLVGS